MVLNLFSDRQKYDWLWFLTTDMVQVSEIRSHGRQECVPEIPLLVVSWTTQPGCHQIYTEIGVSLYSVINMFLFYFFFAVIYVVSSKAAVCLDVFFSFFVVANCIIIIIIIIIVIIIGFYYYFYYYHISYSVCNGSLSSNTPWFWKTFTTPDYSEKIDQSILLTHKSSP